MFTANRGSPLTAADRGRARPPTLMSKDDNAESEHGPAWGRLRRQLQRGLEKDEEDDGEQIEEEEVRRYCERLKKFVVAPGDKEKGDAAIM